MAEEKSGLSKTWYVVAVLAAAGVILRLVGLRLHRRKVEGKETIGVGPYRSSETEDEQSEVELVQNPPKPKRIRPALNSALRAVGGGIARAWHNKQVRLSILFPLQAAGIAAAIWGVIYWLGGTVPTVSEVQFSSAWTIELPIALSRWGDAAFIGLWALLLAIFFNTTMRKSGINREWFAGSLMIGLITAAFVGSMTGLITGEEVINCTVQGAFAAALIVPAVASLICGLVQMIKDGKFLSGLLMSGFYMLVIVLVGGFVFGPLAAFAYGLIGWALVLLILGAVSTLTSLAKD